MQRTESDTSVPLRVLNTTALNRYFDFKWQPNVIVSRIYINVPHGNDIYYFSNIFYYFSNILHQESIFIWSTSPPTSYDAFSIRGDRVCVELSKLTVRRGWLLAQWTMQRWVSHLASLFVTSRRQREGFDRVISTLFWLAYNVGHRWLSNSASWNMSTHR